MIQVFFSMAKAPKESQKKKWHSEKIVCNSYYKWIILFISVIYFRKKKDHILTAENNNI